MKNQDRSQEQYHYQQQHKSLDRLMELMKQLELEAKVQDQIDKLNELAEKEEKLAEQTENNQKDQEQLKKEQDQINKDFQEVKKKMDEIQKENKELKFEQSRARPTPTERMKIFGGRRSGNRGGYVKTVLTLAAVGASHPFSGIFWVFPPIFRNFIFVFRYLGIFFIWGMVN